MHLPGILLLDNRVNVKSQTLHAQRIWIVMGEIAEGKDWEGGVSVGRPLWTLCHSRASDLHFHSLCFHSK